MGIFNQFFRPPHQGQKKFFACFFFFKRGAGFLLLLKVKKTPGIIKKNRNKKLFQFFFNFRKYPPNAKGFLPKFCGPIGPRKKKHSDMTRSGETPQSLGAIPQPKTKGVLLYNNIFFQAIKKPNHSFHNHFIQL